MKGSPFKLRSPLKQDITMDSTIGDVGRKIKNTSIRDAGEGLLNAATGGAYGNVKAIYNKMKQRDGGHDDMMKTRKEPTLPTGVGNDESVRRGGELRKKNQKQNNQAFMKGTAEALSERISSKRKEKPQSAEGDKSSKPSRLSIAINEINSRRVTMTKKSGKLKKKKTEIIQPASKIKPSGIVKNPKI